MTIPIHKSISKVKNSCQQRSSSLGRFDPNAAREIVSVNSEKNLSHKSNKSSDTIDIDLTQEASELCISNENNLLESDGTDSEISESEKSYNRKYSNKKKSQYKAVRHLFKKINNTIYHCNDCNEEVKISGGSDANLRLHLANKHGNEDVLYESQRNRKFHDQSSLSIQDKKRFHNAAVNCILTDSRSFSDLSKLGMKAFLNEIKPGYKPPSRHLIRKTIKKSKYSLFDLLFDYFMHKKSY